VQASRWPFLVVQAEVRFHSIELGDGYEDYGV
jgi:hypothetical protein